MAIQLNLNVVDVYSEFCAELFQSKTNCTEFDNKIIAKIKPDFSDFDKWADELLDLNSIKQEVLGQYHTPIYIAEKILNHLSENFIPDILNGASYCDPSCGTGSFFIALFNILCKNLELYKDEESKKNFIYENILPNMVGIEIDPVLCKAAKLNLSNYFNKIIPDNLIICADSLELFSSTSVSRLHGKFDYVFGNPPWVEAKRLPDNIKSLFQFKYTDNANNLYNAFIYQGILLLKEGGELAYITPRSFTGGKYYEKLRNLLKNYVTLNKLSYFSERNNKFQGGKILQERIIFSLKNQKPNNNIVCCNPQIIESDNTSKIFQVSQDKLFQNYSNIMILANNESELDWFSKITKHPNFDKLGFRFSTGQLVPHRHQDFLRIDNSDSYPIIYTHHLSFKDSKISYNLDFKEYKDRLPYAVTEGCRNKDGRDKKNNYHSGKKINIEKDLNSFDQIIICNRRSHKGDKKRFVGIYLEKPELPEKYFIDNGLNFIVSSDKSYAPSLKCLYFILLSDLFEKFFEIISSNTQINKNDMYLFGIPKINEKTEPIYNQLSDINLKDFDMEKINLLINYLYEMV